jgi:arsenate reductase
MNYLFICLANSCRSIMAEAVARSLVRDSDSIQSCGLSSYPIHKMTLETLTKNGISVASLDSKRASPELIQNADVIVLLDKMIKDRLLVPPTKCLIDHHIDDPMPFADDINATQAFQKTFDAINTLTRRIIK